MKLTPKKYETKLEAQVNVLVDYIKTYLDQLKEPGVINEKWVEEHFKEALEVVGKPYKTKQNNMNEAKLKVLNVNLQHGFLICVIHGDIIAAFNRHKKVIYVKVPNRLADYSIEGDFYGNLNEFEVKEGITDSFGISMWTNTQGQIDI